MAQVNDRRRQKSDVFNKRTLLETRMEQMVWRKGSWSFSPILSIGQIGYDSNLFSLPKDRAISDFVIAPELGMNSYYRLSPKFILNLKASGRYDWYKDNDQLRNWNPNYSASVYSLFKRVYLEFGATYTRDQSRINSEIIARSENERMDYRFSSVFQLTPRLFWDVGFVVNELEYIISNDQFTTYEQNYDRFSTSLYYKKSPSFMPFIEFNLSKTEFLGSNVPYEVEAQAVYVGSRNERGTRLHYLAKFGMKADDYQFLNLEEQPSTEAEDLVYQLYWKYNLTRKVFIEAGANQNVIYSLYDSYTHFLSQRILLGFGYKFKNNTELGPDIYFGKNRYQPREDLDLSEVNFDYLSINLNLKFPILERVMLQFSVGHEDRELPTYSDNVTGWYSFIDLDYRF